MNNIGSTSSSLTNNIIIIIILNTLIPTGARVDVSVSELYDSTYVGNPHDMISQVLEIFLIINPHDMIAQVF